jgi:hypothetical protein
MAISITELELQSTEYLPAREAMSAMAFLKPAQAGMDAPSGSGILNGISVHDVAENINVSDAQFGLVNLLVHHVDDAVDVGTANA